MFRTARYAFLACIAFFSCNTVKNSHIAISSAEWEAKSPTADLAPAHTIYMFGEMGRSAIAENPLSKHIEKALTEADEQSTAIFMGSHLYPKGLSGKSKSGRPAQEAELRDKFSLVKDYKGRLVFLAGEHDWEYRGDLGLKAVKRMQDFFEEELDQKDIFLPEDGCGDPYRLKIERKKDVVFLILNSQWWLEDWENEPKINKGCDVSSRNEMIVRLKELILKNKNKHLFFVMHHPLHSNGARGGKIPAKYHFFPFTEINPRAWFPMPLFGSAAAGHRKINGYRQDLSHPKLSLLKEEIMHILHENRLTNFVFLGSHDHALQYFHQDHHHYIGSGSAGGEGFARKGGKAEFASARSGFAKIVIYENEEVWVEYHALQENRLEVVFRKKLKEGESDVEEVLAEFQFEEIPDSIFTAAGPDYDVKAFRRFWFGDTYRDIWKMPINVKALDVSTERGGLNPLRKGGGMQSNSLRLEDSTGTQYVFRSIYKSALMTTPEFARGTWAQNVLQDMLSASHPYGAFTIPPLSEAAKIYYTEPQLVYIPKQEGLGIYNESFGEELYLYEDRPTGDRSDFDGFGNSKKIVGINDLLPKLQDEHDHIVDQKWVLKSRIFDMYVHDWDRHDDQWRWASFKEDGKTIYRPIPRDRDQVYFTFKGPLPWLASTFALKKFKSFENTMQAPQHQSFNARHFDRYFLTEMELEDWLEEADKLSERMTDSIIEASIRLLPPKVFDEGGQEIIDKLKARRSDIPNMAEGLYSFLAKEVDVVGTNEPDKFKVRRNRGGSTEVRVFKLNKKGKKKDRYYKRTFHADETKEIRLFGLGGGDEFELDGKGKKGILVRIIGGPGNDEVDDDSRIRGPKKLTKIYDETEGIKFDKGKEIQDRTSDQYDVNDYNREEFVYNMFMPTVNFGSNIDDGFFFGGGISATLHGFRKDPYKANHTIGGLFAPKTQAFEFHYNLHRVGTFHRLHSDLFFDADLYNPFYINYYGQGNNTKFDQDKSNNFYWVRLVDYRVALGLQKDWAHERYGIKLSPVFQSSKVVVRKNRISEEPSLGLTDDDKSRKNFLGAAFEATINAVEVDGIRPVDGMAINFQADYANRLRSADQYVRLSGDFQYYLTFFKKIPTTLATRVGGGATFGEVPFYHSNHVGGDNYLRGFRRNRYSGKYMFYQNIDLRVRLVYWKNVVMPMEIGILGGFDYGRVWEPKESSNKLHKGYTAGIWITPFTVASIVFNYSFGEEEKLFNFGFGFFF